MIKYVSKQGSNSNSGNSLGAAYLTIGYAVSQLPSGGAIYVYPGGYTEMVEPANGTKLIAVSEHGEVEIAGDGNRDAVEIWGKHDVLVDGFVISNNGATLVGWSVPSGISIADLGNTAGVGRNSYNITIQNCTFRNVLRKNDAAGNGAQAISFRSFSDERLGEEACHNIQILNCRFEAGKHNMVGSGLFIGQVNPGGNVRDWIIDGCTFYWDETIYNESSTGIEMVAGYLSPAYPDLPRKGVISNNTFIWVGDHSGDKAVYAIYCQGQDILIENNDIQRWGLGIGVVKEDGTNPDPFPAARVWVRNNSIANFTNYGVVVGAWADTYTTVEDVWVTGNTINKPDVGVGEFPPVCFISRNTSDSPQGWTGSCRFVGNRVATPGSVFLLEKAWDNLTSLNHFYTDSATPVRYPNYGTQVNWPWSFTASADTTSAYTEALPAPYQTIPTWYVEGLFGDYNPVIVPPAPQGVTPRPRRRKYYFLND